jgi:cytochrome c oxidase subunit II
MRGSRIAAPGVTFILLHVTGCHGPFATLDPAGPSASSAAALWWGMFLFFALVMLFVIGIWLYAMYRDPGPQDEQATRRLHGRLLVGGGLALPLVSIAVLLAFGIPAGHKMLPWPPAEGMAVRIDVRGHQWWWETSYPGTGIRLVDEIHMPAGVPVDVHLTSADVIHSFWVPRLAGKLDAIPGHENVLRLRTDTPGVYRGQCAEFCGLRHAHMQFTVFVHTREDFEAWLEVLQQDD